MTPRYRVYSTGYDLVAQIGPFDVWLRNPSTMQAFNRAFVIWSEADHCSRAGHNIAELRYRAVIQTPPEGFDAVCAALQMLGVP